MAEGTAFEAILLFLMFLYQAWVEMILILFWITRYLFVK